MKKWTDKAQNQIELPQVMLLENKHLFIFISISAALTDKIQLITLCLVPSSIVLSCGEWRVVERGVQRNFSLTVGLIPCF